MVSFAPSFLVEDAVALVGSYLLKCCGLGCEGNRELPSGIDKIMEDKIMGAEGTAGTGNLNHG
jgi:hypothetical protein